jgi:hypothetical protein
MNLGSWGASAKFAPHHFFQMIDQRPQLVAINSCFITHIVCQKHKVFGGEIARAAWRKWATPKPPTLESTTRTPA